MYVYLSQIDVEVHLPSAIDAEVVDEAVHFVDTRGDVVATFPASAVVMYSKDQSYRQASASSDGSAPKTDRK